MTLLLDVGSTRLKWGVLGEESFTPGGSAVHRGRPPPEVLAECLGSVSPPGRIVAGCVAGNQFAEALRHYAESQWGTSPEFLHAQAEVAGVRNGYREPGRLGVDRWAALLATRDFAHGAACIVDCGTAITVDALGADGSHLGGLIVPGLELGRQCLLAATTGVAEAMDADQDPASVGILARDTRNAVTGGALYATVAFVDRIVQDVGAALGGRMVRVLTGGDADRLLPLLAGRYRHEPWLVLRGLAVMARGAGAAA
jgi:type III pantothenate kinase